MKRFRWAALGFLSIFLVLLAIRMDLPARFFTEGIQSIQATPLDVPDSDTWMDLTLNDRKIGYTHSTLTRSRRGYHLQEMLFMRMNVMGFSQDIRMDTAADLNPDLSLSTFDFCLSSGRFESRATGKLKPGNVLAIETDLSGSLQRTDIQLEHAPHLTGIILLAAAREAKFSPGSRLAFHLFDPATLSQDSVSVSVVGQEEIFNMGKRIQSTRLELQYKGTTQTAWIDPQGEVIREKGLLGLSLERTSKERATAGQSFESAGDITEIASVPTSVKIDSPRKTIFLKVELGGLDLSTLNLAGGRQRLAGNILTIRTENPTAANGTDEDPKPEELKRFLVSEPFIESDHPAITELAQTATSDMEAPLAKAQKLVEWVFNNIQKRPVISMPDALTTLHNRMGDCNEHAVLLAALARSVGIPAKIESGLVYLNGRFYYHAWNLLHVGRWVTADAVFGQLPADATHIRFASGNPESQLDLLPIIDKIRLSVLEAGG